MLQSFFRNPLQDFLPDKCLALPLVFGHSIPFLQEGQLRPPQQIQLPCQLYIRVYTGDLINLYHNLFIATGVLFIYTNNSPVLRDVLIRLFSMQR